ncbi:MAG TPA: sigma-70 family RNA polymerase sigma factor [Steroidobacteraceae bacterium]
MPTDVTPEQRDLAWSQLMRAAQDGDRAAYSRLLREVTPFVRAMLRRHCSHPHDVEEMVQETLLTLHRVRQTYDPARPFCPWLGAIAARRGIDGLRRRARRARHEISADPESYETFIDPEANTDMEGVRAAGEVEELLRRLPPRQRAALEAVKLKEMSLAQASVVSGQSVGALKVNTHRALKTLRALFRDTPDR